MTNLVVIVVTVAALTLIGSPGAAVDESIVHGSRLFGLALLIFPAVYIWHFVRTPAILAAEDNATTAARFEALEASISALRAEKETEESKISLCNYLTVLKTQAVYLHGQKIKPEQFEEWKRTVREWLEVAVTFARTRMSAEIAGRLTAVRWHSRKVAYEISEEHRDEVLALEQRIAVFEREIDLLKPYWRRMTAPETEAIERSIMAIRDVFRAQRGQSDTSTETRP